eukprot:1144324-Pelagomonas_calceolata.AAC.1
MCYKFNKSEVNSYVALQWQCFKNAGCSNSLAYFVKPRAQQNCKNRKAQQNCLLGRLMPCYLKPPYTTG